MADKTRAQKSAPASGTPDAVCDRVTVTDSALATLIGLAAHEVPGIIGMSPANLREGIKRILGKQQADEGVEISRSGETATVDLYVAVAYGVNIPAVAESVRERVLYAAKAFAGVEVERVGVHIAGVGRAGR
jgi:uncharacterized alkaline shock family protein YloU